MRTASLFKSVVCVVAVSACASAGTGGGSPAPAPATGTQQTNSIATRWPIKTREHVDLWLHGYAMLQEDSTFVPYFRRGYRDPMIVLKNRANVITQLDATRDKLRARLTANPSLVNAQFVPLSFGSWDEMSQMISVFLQAD